jgi:hypothetical protein
MIEEKHYFVTTLYYYCSCLVILMFVTPQILCFLSPLVLLCFVLFCFFLFSFSTYRSPKLRILDLRQDAGCKTVCPEISTNSTICFRSCAHSEHSIFKIEGQESLSSSKSEAQPSRLPMELIVDISLDGTLRERNFFALLQNKVEQSLGSLHLCCRDLQINNLCECRHALSHLDLKCVDHLAVDESPLTEVTKLLSHTIQLDSLSLSKIACRSLNGRTFRNFITQLSRMNHLKELSLSSFCLTDHLETVLR